MKYTGWELKYFDSSSNFRKYQFSLIKEFIGEKILEVGPGSGNFANNFLIKVSKKLHLTEISKDLFEKLKIKFELKKNVEVYSKAISEIDSKFDTICYFDVLEHIENHELEIKEALKRLNKNGKLIIIVPAFNHLYSYYDKSIGHYRRYEKEFFQNFIKKNNLIKKKLIYFDSVGYFFLLINKFVNMKSESKVGLGTIIWNLLVPISKIIDKILFHKFGKSLICVIQNAK
tara:strand:+ start:965 stop:1654 length:690 start_codon:yes stop_codon:yes gene_type:complete